VPASAACFVLDGSLTDHDGAISGRELRVAAGRQRASDPFGLLAAYRVLLAPEPHGDGSEDDLAPKKN
jgi:hypothetical protein